MRSTGSVLGLPPRCWRWPSGRRHGVSRSTRSFASSCPRASTTASFALPGKSWQHTIHQRSAFFGRRSRRALPSPSIVAELYVWHSLPLRAPQGLGCSCRGASRFFGIATFSFFAVRHRGGRRPRYRSMVWSGSASGDSGRSRTVQGRDERTSSESRDERGRVQREDLWVADLPADRRLSVRAWRPADRMRPRTRGAARRVKRFFGDAQIPGPSRAGWPVVLADDEIVWIPGVRRSDAASERSGRPVVRYACERTVGGLRDN